VPSVTHGADKLLLLQRMTSDGNTGRRGGAAIAVMEDLRKERSSGSNFDADTFLCIALASAPPLGLGSFLAASAELWLSISGENKQNLTQ
jgi:hypothetical protein